MTAGENRAGVISQSPERSVLMPKTLGSILFGMTWILVIDDQDSIRRLLRRALEQEGHEVLDASDGAMGMQLLERQPVDVVITAIFMPGQDGITTLRHIRKDFPDVKVIVISGGDTT